MDELRAYGTRRATIVGVVPTLLAVGVAVGGVAAYWFVTDGGLDCSPPSHEELRTQEAFARAHLRDVRDVELGVMNDDGIGYVSFTTSRTQEAARAAFLADGSCSTDTDLSRSDVTCTSAGVPVYLSFEDDGWTRGVLSVSDRHRPSMTDVRGHVRGMQLPLFDYSAPCGP